MNLYFDCEFTGLRKDTTLISIGIVAENGKKFYAEFTDYDKNQCDGWIEDNVLRNLKNRYNNENYLSFKPEITELSGKEDFILNHLKIWLDYLDEENFQFVSDVCHYDFVLLIDLFGSAWDLPKNITPSCHDINQDIAEYYGISEKDAFDRSREEILQELCGETIKGDKHNALYDAEVIKVIYEKIVTEGDN